MSAHGPLAGEARHRPLCPILGGQRTARALAEPFGSWPRLCENSDVELARRISVSISSLWKTDCTGNFC